MTAEQLLIEENKINPQIKYITKASHEIWFWRNKPQYFGYWCDGSGYKIGMSVTFNGKDDSDCILCIDDIKQEIPPIPKKWYIECTEENREILNGWRLKNAKGHLGDDCFMVGNVLVSKNVFDNSLYFGGTLQNIKQSQNYKDYQEITLEQFKKYVLCEHEEKHELKDVYTTGIIGSNEEKQEEKEFIEKRKAIRESMKGIGRIVSTDINGNPFPEPTNNSSFEFYSTRCWIEDRINYINKFIRKNIDSNLCIPIEWVEERNELIEKLKNL